MATRVRTPAQLRKPPGTPKPRHQEIIDAAAEIFQRKGYEATSIQDIADVVGILKGSLYYYVDSKEDILFEVIRQVHESAMEWMRRTHELATDPLERIRAFIEGHVQHITTNLVKAAAFFHDFRSLSPERQEIILKERDVYDNVLRDLIIEGQRTGVVCRDVDPKLTAMGVFGMMNWLYQWYRADGQFGAAAVGRSFANLVVAGLACDADSHVPGHRDRVGIGVVDHVAIDADRV